MAVYAFPECAELISGLDHPALIKIQMRFPFMLILILNLRRIYFILELNLGKFKSVSKVFQ